MSEPWFLWWPADALFSSLALSTDIRRPTFCSGRREGGSHVNEHDGLQGLNAKAVLAKIVRPVCKVGGCRGDAVETANCFIAVTQSD